MGRTGTNNGGGPRWADMPRGACPKCGLTRPVGVTQHERGFYCTSPSKCKVRAKKRLAKESEARRRAFAFMDGFRCAAGTTPIEPGVGADPDFQRGWEAGKAAKDDARREAETLTGYKFARLRPS